MPFDKAELILQPETPRPLVSKEDIDLPVLTLADLASVEHDRGYMHFFEGAVQAPKVERRAYQAPVRPVPVYPQEAITQGIEGDCEVRFNVSVKGEPYDVVANCTHPVFKQEAERALREIRFVPKIMRGEPVERRNVVYPIMFRMDE